MSSIQKLVYETSFMYDHLKDDLAALGGVLRCKTCGHQIPLADIDIAESLKSGWPRHCDGGMRWLTQKELNQERSNT